MVEYIIFMDYKAYDNNTYIEFKCDVQVRKFIYTLLRSLHAGLFKSVGLKNIKDYNCSTWIVELEDGLDTENLKQLIQLADKVEDIPDNIYK